MSEAEEKLATTIINELARAALAGQSEETKSKLLGAYGTYGLNLAKEYLAQSK